MDYRDDGGSYVGAWVVTRKASGGISRSHYVVATTHDGLIPLCEDSYTRQPLRLLGEVLSVNDPDETRCFHCSRMRDTPTAALGVADAIQALMANTSPMGGDV